MHQSGRMTFGLKGLQTKNMKRLICILMLIVISISFSSSPVCAETGKEHQKDFESILFGSDKLEKKEKQISKIFAAAAYLTIDQFKTYGQNYLDTLEKNGVRNLPTLEEISIEGGGKHRLYAHNGWDSEYHHLKYRNRYNDPAWEKKWKSRKGIIESAVNKVFNFNWWSGIPLVGDKIPDSSEECDSFCALIYYIHLLGDHKVTHTLDEYALLMPLGGRYFEDTVVSELQYHCEVLFAEQVDTDSFKNLESSLEDIDVKCLKMGTINKENKEKKLEENQELAKELFSALEKYVPTLLKNEEFFYNAVYKEKSAA